MISESLAKQYYNRSIGWLANAKTEEERIKFEPYVAVFATILELDKKEVKYLIEFANYIK